MTEEKAVVLFSGGQDSTTCLVWAIDKWGPSNVFPVLFNYGQRHAVELAQAGIILSKLLPGHEPVMLDVAALNQIGGAALTDPGVDVNVDAADTGNVYAEAHGLPSTFVPGRNMLFLTLALAYGARHGAYNLVTGVCEADEAGYPDCRKPFVEAARYALALAIDEKQVQVHAPLIKATKAETFKLAEDLGVLDLVLEETHTCYHGNRDVRLDWGYGCGECGSCVERAKGYAQFRAGPAYYR